MIKQSPSTAYYKYAFCNRSQVPVYWLSYDTNKKCELKLPLVYGKLAYCRLYEKFVTSQPLFKIVCDQYKSFDGDVTICSYGAYPKLSNFGSQEDLINMFIDPKYDFCDCYCLIEILVNYPKTENCFWNNDEIIQPILNAENEQFVQLKQKYNLYHLKVGG